MNSIVNFKSVTKKYCIRKQEINAVNNITFSVNKGALAAITGPSGSGKSTILNLIGRLELPTSGNVYVNSHNIGIVFQNFYLDPNLTLRQNIELHAIFRGIPKSVRSPYTAELAHTSGLENYLDRLPSELSGGQIQRATILRAIYSQPEIILADEPTSNLDGENASMIINMLKAQQKNTGCTIIISTHDKKILSIADQTINMKNGAKI